MIRSVSCDQKSFRTVHFKAGFNVVLADRTKESTRKDSRNGLGKSTLIDIIHFTLGSEPRAGEGLLVDPLKGWTFTTELDLNGSIVSVSRNTATPKVIILQGHFDDWPIKPNYNKEMREFTLSNKEWTSVLGHFMFGLPIEGYPFNYTPKFRSLISYFVRRTKDAFSTPFEHYRKQIEWDKQVNNAFLLGLAWEDASEWQRLRDTKNHIDNLRKAAKAGLLNELLGSLGELEAEKIRLEGSIDQYQRGLSSFNILPQYYEVQREADALTHNMQLLGNSRFSDERRLKYCEESLVSEQHASEERVKDIFAEAGIVLANQTLKRLEDVQKFHAAIVKNRRVFLEEEIEALKRKISSDDAALQDMAEKRSKLMAILASHGSWEEYSQIQKRQSEAIARLENLKAQISRLRELEEGQSALRIATEMLRTKARRDYAERSEQRERAVRIFNENSEALYEAPGSLVINIADTGYKFDVEILRSGSGGVGNMKIFSYDLTLAELWSVRNTHAPGFLIHDSVIFEGVDERQIANAIRLAAFKSEKSGFQYICTINSDSVPYQELGSDFDFSKYVRIRLTDEAIEGSLLGIRY